MTAPCQEACPTEINIPQFLYLANEGNFNEALLTILKENPFNGTALTVPAAGFVSLFENTSMAVVTAPGATQADTVKLTFCLKSSAFE